jgi:hypothetical protein
MAFPLHYGQILMYILYCVDGDVGEESLIEIPLLNYSSEPDIVASIWSSKVVWYADMSTSPTMTFSLYCEVNFSPIFFVFDDPKSIMIFRIWFIWITYCGSCDIFEWLILRCSPMVVYQFKPYAIPCFQRSLWHRYAIESKGWSHID